jgi:hypothetical protein
LARIAWRENQGSDNHDEDRDIGSLPAGVRRRGYPRIGLDTAKAHLVDVLYPAYARFQEGQTRASGLEVAQAA